MSTSACTFGSVFGFSGSAAFGLSFSSAFRFSSAILAFSFCASSYFLTSSFISGVLRGSSSPGLRGTTSESESPKAAIASLYCWQPPPFIASIVLSSRASFSTALSRSVLAFVMASCATARSFRRVTIAAAARSCSARAFVAAASCVLAVDSNPAIALRIFAFSSSSAADLSAVL